MRNALLAFAALLFALLCSIAPVVAAQDLACAPGRLEVVRLAFEGNVAFSSATLADGIVTTPSSWARRTLGALGRRRSLDRQEFPRDVVRLLIWYRNHGYSAATVDTIITPLGAERIGVRFSIHEGAPMIVDSLAIVGLDAVPERDALVRRLPARAGRRFDKYANDTTRETLTRRLRNAGYPDAEVFVGYDTHTTERRGGGGGGRARAAGGGGGGRAAGPPGR